MAKIENGYMGGFVGKLGPAVGYLWRGKWCVRSLQPSARNPRTEAQQRHRMMFKEEVQLAGYMNWVLRKTLDALALEEHMTACNYFVSRNQHAFSWVDDALSVDWPSLVLSEGPVAPVGFGTPSVEEGNVLSVSFEKNPLHLSSDPFDHVQLYVYCPEMRSGFLSAPVYRRDRRIAVALPDEYRGREVLVWGMVEDAAGRWSETLYIGGGILEEGATDEGVSAAEAAETPAVQLTQPADSMISATDATPSVSDARSVPR